MKRCTLAKICFTLCLILGMTILPVNRMTAQASAVIATVQGTISSKTTADVLYLSTNEGNMEIKLDSGTDTSSCKILIPGKKISVSVSYGTDGWLHAVKITSEVQTTAVTVDTSNTVTVSGKLGDKTKDDILYLNTSQGEMQIKFDENTNLSDCAVLIVGETYSVTCARGSDAWLHAVSVSDKVTASGSAAGVSSPGNNTAFMSVTGTVASSTKENLLYLSTKEGEMQFVIDYNADTSKGMVLTPGRQLTVYFYHGTDGYLHAVLLAGVKDAASSAQINTTSTVSVTGTVGSNSTENLLYLETPQGTMELKLDAVSSMQNCKVLISGKKITVSCAYGSDAYLHAVSITGV